MYISLMLRYYLAVGLCFQFLQYSGNANNNEMTYTPPLDCSKFKILITSNTGQSWGQRCSFYIVGR